MNKILLSLFVGISVISEVTAEALQIKLDGSRTQVSVDVMNTKLLSFYAITKGNSSSLLSITGSFPAGATLRVQEAILNDKPLNKQLSNTRNFWKLPLRTAANIDRDNSSCISFSPGEGSPETDDIPDIAKPESNDPRCNLFTEQNMVVLGEALASTHGGVWSRSQVCGYLMNNYQGGAEPCDPALDPICAILQSLDEPTLKWQLANSRKTQYLTNQTQKFTTLIQKNACSAKSARYLVRIDIDLTKIPVLVEPPTMLSIQAIEYQYSGDRAASIKPTSDGKYAPQPILLMSFLGSFCGQKLNVTQWTTNRPRSTTTLKVADLIPYKGRVLTRTPIGRILRGGKASFDLHSSSSAYGVCFSLIAKRQRVNGY